MRHVFSDGVFSSQLCLAHAAPCPLLAENCLQLGEQQELQLSGPATQLQLENIETNYIFTNIDN